MRQTGGERTMADVLACVPQFGLDTVLVAASLALEDITPSGQLGIEHVKNILARLNSPPIPDPVSTMLVVKEAPVADTARYDRLRPMSQAHQEVRHAY
jgi:hypothetical protein